MSKASRERQFKRRIASGELRLPTRDELIRKLQSVAESKCEWAGFPMLLDDFPLTLEPKYPYQLQLEKHKKEEEPSDYEIINSWWNERLGTTTQIVLNLKTGKRFINHVVGCNKITMLINTLGASNAWLIEAETKAIEKLRELTTDVQMRYYGLTGTFLESSKRSGVCYMFRRLRPTIAFVADHRDGTMRGLCALCRHGIGYYSGTHAGAMVPTDDVIAALIWMRGDEHKFWAGCNQHALYTPQAAV